LPGIELSFSFKFTINLIQKSVKQENLLFTTNTNLAYFEINYFQSLKKIQQRISILSRNKCLELSPKYLNEKDEPISK
jgi:hypothetical protein